MGTAAYGGKGFKERAAVSGERPIGTASCRQQTQPGVMPNHLERLVKILICAGGFEPLTETRNQKTSSKLGCKTAQTGKNFLHDTYLKMSIWLVVYVG